MEEYIQKFKELQKITDEVDFNNPVSVKLNNKAMDEKIELLKLINSLQENEIRSFMESILNIDGKFNTDNAFLILDFMHPPKDIIDKCLFEIKEKIKREGVFAHKLWLKNWYKKNHKY